MKQKSSKVSLGPCDKVDPKGDMVDPKGDLVDSKSDLVDSKSDKVDPKNDKVDPKNYKVDPKKSDSQCDFFFKKTNTSVTDINYCVSTFFITG